MPLRAAPLALAMAGAYFRTDQQHVRSMAYEGIEVSEASLDQLYAEHLQTLMGRADRSLAAAGFDALVIHSGRPLIQFLDDQDYPYKVNPHFKAWVPIVDNPQCFAVYAPGSRLRVLLHQSNDFWHKRARRASEEQLC